MVSRTTLSVRALMEVGCFERNQLPFDQLEVLGVLGGLVRFGACFFRGCWGSLGGSVTGEKAVVRCFHKMPPRSRFLKGSKGSLRRFFLGRGG